MTTFEEVLTEYGNLMFECGEFDGRGYSDDNSLAIYEALCEKTEIVKKAVIARFANKWGLKYD